MIGGIGVTPYAAAQFTTFDLPAYTEQAITGANTFALGYAAKSVTDPRSELGIRTDKSLAGADGMLTLRGRLAWAHNFNPDRSVGRGASVQWSKTAADHPRASSSCMRGPWPPRESARLTSGPGT